MSEDRARLDSLFLKRPVREQSPSFAAFHKLRFTRFSQGIRKCVATGGRDKAHSASQLSTIAHSWQSASKALNLYSRISSSYVVGYSLTAEEPYRLLRILAPCLGDRLQGVTVLVRYQGCRKRRKI